ncbi:MAG: hypothetical protein U1A78_32280 [Polyangia bacterium]
MALQFTGRDVALQRNEATGKFDLQFSTEGPNVGNPVLDSTCTHAVLTTLLSKKRGTRPGSPLQEGGYYFDTTGRRGTLLWTVNQDRLATPSQLKAYAEDGAQQLVDLRYIASFDASARKRGPGNFLLTCRWFLPSSTTPLSVSL